MVRIVLIVVALVLAAASGWMVKLYLSAQRQQIAELAASLKPTAAPAENVEVLVVRDGLDIAGVLGGGNLRWQAWPADGVNARYITRKARPDAIDKLTGAAARQPLFAGEPVTEDKIVSKQDGSFLAATLPEGGRAVAVKVDEATGLAGLVLPGDRVDVILTHDIPVRQDDGTGGVQIVKSFVSEVIARDLRVIAVDQEIRHGEKPTASNQGKTISLAVDGAQAEAISLGRVMGTLSLSLRSAFAASAPDPHGRAYTSATDISAALSQRVAPPVRTASGYAVTVYHGTTAETVTVTR